MDWWGGGGGCEIVLTGGKSVNGSVKYLLVGHLLASPIFWGKSF